MNTNSASSVEFRIVYWLSTCKVLSAFVKYLIDTWYVGAPMKLFIGFRGDMTQLLQQDYEMVVIWLSLHECHKKMTGLDATNSKFLV